MYSVLQATVRRGASVSPDIQLLQFNKHSLTNALSECSLMALILWVVTWPVFVDFNRQVVLLGNFGHKVTILTELSHLCSTNWVLCTNRRLTSRGLDRNNQRAGYGPRAIKCPGLVLAVALGMLLIKLVTCSARHNLNTTYRPDIPVGAVPALHFCGNVMALYKCIVRENDRPLAKDEPAGVRRDVAPCNTRMHWYA